MRSPHPAHLHPNSFTMKQAHHFPSLYHRRGFLLLKCLDNSQAQQKFLVHGPRASITRKCAKNVNFSRPRPTEPQTPGWQQPSGYNKPWGALKLETLWSTASSKQLDSWDRSSGEAGVINLRTTSVCHTRDLAKIYQGDLKRVTCKIAEYKRLGQRHRKPANQVQN